MGKLIEKVTRRGWVRSWQLWTIGIILGVCIQLFYPAKFGSTVLMLERFFLLAGAGYLCLRIFFPIRFHEMVKDDPTRNYRTLGVYIYLMGCAIGAGAGAWG